MPSPEDHSQIVPAAVGWRSSTNTLLITESATRATLTPTPPHLPPFPAHLNKTQDAYDWPASKVILDVGGGRGELLSTVMSWAGPECKGLLLDVQMVIDRCVVLV